MVCVRLMRTLCWESSTLESLSFERWGNYQTRILVMTGYVIGCPWYEFFFVFSFSLLLEALCSHQVPVQLILYPRYFVMYTSPPPKIMFNVFTASFRGVKTDPNDLKWFEMITGKSLPLTKVTKVGRVMWLICLTKFTSSHQAFQGKSGGVSQRNRSRNAPDLKWSWFFPLGVLDATKKMKKMHVIMRREQQTHSGVWEQSWQH